MQSFVNRVKLMKLYSIPKIFDDIIFKDGLNMILGEKCDENNPIGRKTNGVGKSICVEFINFCLLKEYDKSRVAKIPPKILNDDIEIILELMIKEENITIKRSIKNPNVPKITYKSEEREFKDLTEATKFVEKLIYSNEGTVTTTSYRELVSCLMREETSGFNNILNYYDATKKIPDNPKPLLYMLRIDIDIYLQIKNIIKDIELTQKKINDLKNKLTNNKTIKLEEVRAELNAMDDQVEKMELAIESVKSNQAFETLQSDLIHLEETMEKLRTKQKIIRYEMKKIKSLPEPEKVNTNEIKLMYEFFKEGLGNVVEKSLDEVIKFKEKIEDYQNKLITEKYETLEKENKDITELLRKYDEEYSNKMKIIDSKGVLKNLKNSIKIYADKSKELGEKNQKLKSLDEEEAYLKRIKSDKTTTIITLDKLIQENDYIIKSYEDTIYSIHQQIMGNKKCYFKIKTKENGKNVIEIELRIDADGSFSIDRTKVFLYDISLLFNKETRKRHPKFLIHDNIFSVDQDTLIQSLNFLSKQDELFEDFQYIVTLNRDMVENEESKLNFKINDCTIASFTKNNKFLKTDYQEL